MNDDSFPWRVVLRDIAVGFVCIPLLPLIIVGFVLWAIIAVVAEYGGTITEWWDDNRPRRTPTPTPATTTETKA